MPYRRLPKTDSARLKALKTVLENNNVYTVQNRFIDWKTLNRAQPAYDKLLTASEQYKMRMAAQTRNAPKMDRLMRNAILWHERRPDGCALAEVGRERYLMGRENR